MSRRVSSMPTPHYNYIDTGSAALGPRVYTSLPAEALQFAYDIDAMRIDPNFAKVDVWEHGYFYAFAAQQTYERAADTVFILERRQDDGRWLITAHQSGSYGIPPQQDHRSDARSARSLLCDGRQGPGSRGGRPERRKVLAFPLRDRANQGSLTRPGTGAPHRRWVDAEDLFELSPGISHDENGHPESIALRFKGIG